jgi:hypothetical protein
MAGQEFEIPLKFADLEDGDGPFSVKELDERATSAPEDLAKSEFALDFWKDVHVEQRVSTLTRTVEVSSSQFPPK